MTAHVTYDVQGWYSSVYGWETVDSADTQPEAYASRDVYRTEDPAHSYRVVPVIDHPVRPQH
jgi:hypothetical protein